MKRTKFFNDDIYEFLEALGDETHAKILGLLEVLDEYGVNLGPPKLKKVTKEIYELRVIGKISVRILCCFNAEQIYILNAFVKKSQKLPRKELDRAIKRFKLL